MEGEAEIEDEAYECPAIEDEAYECPAIEDEAEIEDEAYKCPAIDVGFELFVSTEDGEVPIV